MANTVARLVSVAVREVWSDEARELTPFLAANPDYLSEALGMDLELEGAEIAVGSFAADLLFLERNTGERVVVENLIGNTDHDHLGKIITYAAGLDSRHAVLIAETFRPEHRSALLWLNANSRESVSFFGIVLKLWRVEGAPADSPAALQLNVVVQPDEWARRVREDRDRKLTDTQLAYRDFWSEFLPAFHARYTSWSRTKATPTVNWLSLPAGKTDVSYVAGFCGPRRFRIELYVDAQDPDDVTRRFDTLMERRGEIEEQFGEELEWERLESKRASRIACYFRADVRVEERDRWPDVRNWAIDRLGPLREALQPHVDALV